MIGYEGEETAQNDFQLFNLHEEWGVMPQHEVEKRREVDSRFRWDGNEFSFQHIDLEEFQSTWVLVEMCSSNLVIGRKMGWKVDLGSISIKVKC